MSLSTLALIGRALLFLISFIGLCATVRTSLKVNRFIAPFIAVSTVVAVLMLSGMLRILEPAFWVLYAAGFVGFIYTYFIRREKPEYGLLIAAFLYIAFLTWRYYPCKLSMNDDISHWGLVARHVLRYDAFPDGKATYVFFQSYPLGMASFIYYVCKTIGNSEGLWLIAQNFILAPLFLPLFSHISNKRKQCYPVALACFVLLFHYYRFMKNLQVDNILAFFGIGMIASITHYRDNLKYALLAAIPSLVAVVYIKNSGMYFALMSVLVLIWVAKRCEKKTAYLWKLAVITIAGFIGAYLLWILHIRLSYPSALDTKHAVSLSAYASEVTNKGLNITLQVLKRLVSELFGFTMNQLIATAVVLGSFILLAYGCHAIPGQKAQLPAVTKAILACVGAYGVWFIMLCGMYLFSMPEEEALIAASFWRYNGSGMLYLMGLVFIVFLSFWGREEIALAVPKLFTAFCGFAVFALVLIAVLYPIPALQGIRALGRNTQYSNIRRQIITARQEHQLDDDDHFLIFCNSESDEVGTIVNYYYQIKYEFETTNIHMIAEKDGLFLAGTWDDKEFYKDTRPFLADTMDQCDVMLVMNKSPEFESQLNDFLETYTGDTPVVYSYNY